MLFEKPGRNQNQSVGRSPYLHPVHAEGDAGSSATIARVRIEKRTANSLNGTLI